MSRRVALRCFVTGCGKPIRKGQAVFIMTFGDYEGRNEEGRPLLRAWLQPGPVHLRCSQGMTPAAFAELLRERRAQNLPPTGDREQQ